jgi:hypothetical protein
LAVVATGCVRDRPFARTIYAIAAKRFDGDLVMEQGGKRYKLTWQGGLVVAADSTAATDSVGRIALKAHLVNSTQLGDALRVMTTSNRPHLDVLAEIGKLHPQQVVTLKQRVLAHRAARIFALDEANFTLEDTPTMQLDPDVPGLDCRWLIYNGVRAYYSPERIEEELAPLRGGAFQISAEHVSTLGAFGFGETEKPFLAAMHAAPETIDNLLGTFSTIDRSMLLAAIYALASTSYLQPVEGAQRPVPKPEPVPLPKPQPQPQPAPKPPSEPKPVVRRAPTPGPVSDSQRRSSQKYAAVVAPKVRATATGRATYSPDAIRQTIDEKLAAMKRKADHFELLGVSQGASAQDITASYFALAKKLHPDRLRAVGVADRGKGAHRLFAHINEAFDTLTNPKKRVEYMKVLAAGGEDAVRRDQEDAERLAAKVFGAEEAFLKGQMALRHQQFRTALEEFTKAVELNPDEGEHHAMYAWATWCAASDKDAVVKQVKKSLTQAITLSPKNTTTYLYRGRIAQQRDQLDTAMECFRKVLDLDPDNKDAELELRLLQKRKDKDSKSRGLFGRLKRS